MARDRRAVIGTAIWNEPSIQALPFEAQHAYLLAYTQPDLSRCGVLPFRPRRWAKLAKNLTVRHLTRQFAALHDSKHVVLDEDEGELLIRTYVGHDGLLAQPLVVAAMVRDFQEVTSDLIRLAILRELRRLWDQPTPAITDAERKGLLLLLGADPSDLGIASDKPQQLDRIRGAIGDGFTRYTRDAITDGHVDPYPEDLRDGLGKALPDPLADALTRGRSRVSPSPTPAPTPTPPPPPEGPPDPTAAAAQILDKTGPWSDATRQALTPHINAALDRELDPAGITTAVIEWANRDNRTPALLPLLIDDHAKPANGKPAARPPWCGQCEEETRLVLDDNRDPVGPCPECKP